jgi:hypothetical protein
VQHAGAVASAASHLNCSTPNSTGYWDLTSLVFNAQPFTNDAIFTTRGINLMNLTFNAAGADALMATGSVQRVTNALGVDITNQFPLIAANRQPGEFVANPLRDPAGNGVANVFAMRGGFQSSLHLNRMRVDGGTRPTNNWNFGGFNLTDMGTLGVTTVNATNKVATNFLQLNTQIEDNTSCGRDMLNAITLSSVVAARLLRCNGATWEPLRLGGRYIASETLVKGGRGYKSFATQWSCTQFIAIIQSIVINDLFKWENAHYGTECSNGKIVLFVNHPTSGMTVSWAIFEQS